MSDYVTFEITLRKEANELAIFEQWCKEHAEKIHKKILMNPEACCTCEYEIVAEKTAMYALKNAIHGSD